MTTNYKFPWNGVNTDFSQVYASQTPFTNISGSFSSWGGNQSGEFGDGTSAARSSPVQVSSVTGWRSLASGPCFIFGGIQTNGNLFMCGYNGSGQLGQGNTTVTSNLVQVAVGTTWNNISCGYVTAAVRSDNSLWTWGKNTSGELGQSIPPATSPSISIPGRVGLLNNWKQVAVGGANATQFVAAVKTDGTLWTWGSNVLGQLGQNDIVSRSSPMQVGSLATWKQVSCGRVGFSTGTGQTNPNTGGHVAAIKTDGTLWVWGSNGAGECGQNNVANISSPTQFGTATNWSSVYCGYACTFAITTTGQLWATGFNSNGIGTAGFGQLGDGTVASKSSPVQIGSLTNWKTLSPLYGNGGGVLAVKTDGTAWTWGGNAFGQLGIGNTTTTFSSPVQLGSLSNWSIAASTQRDFFLGTTLI